jgi:hypothetical protein
MRGSSLKHVVRVLVALTAPALLFGQASYQGQIRGVVTDSSGGVVPNAKITITDVNTNASNSTVTDLRGYYIFNGVRPGTYDVKAEAQGFQAAERKGAVLGVSQETAIDFRVQPAGVATNITVTEAAPLLDTGSASLGTNIASSSTRDIPLYGRSYFGLVFLAAGVTETTGSGIADSYPSGTNFVSNGQRNATAELDHLNLEHGISANDATHRLAGVMMFDIRVGWGWLLGSHMNRVLEGAIGGWSLSSSFTIQTGQPPAIGMVNPRLADGNQRPNVICSQPGTGISYHNAASTGASLFNAACFADPGDQQPGNAPRYF